MNKKILALLAVCATMLCALSITAFAEVGDTVTIDGIIYTQTGENTAAISGHTDELGADITIPNTVSINETECNVDEIYSAAFASGTGNATLETVTFEDDTNVTKIGENDITELPIYTSDSTLKMMVDMHNQKDTGTNELKKGMVFFNCTSLKAVNKWPAAVKTIPAGTFFSCKSLKTFEIPDGTTTIGAYAFALSGLELFDVPSSVTSIGYGVCSDTESLAEAVINADVEAANPFPATAPEFAMSGLIKTAPFDNGKIYGRVLLRTSCKAVIDYFSSTLVGGTAAGLIESTHGKPLILPLIDEEPPSAEEQATTPDSSKLMVVLEDVVEDSSDTMYIRVVPVTPDEEDGYTGVYKFTDIEFEINNCTDDSLMAAVASNLDEHIAMTSTERTEREALETESGGSKTRTGKYVFYVQPYTVDDESSPDNGEEVGYVSVPSSGLIIGTITLNGYGTGNLYIDNGNANKETADSIATPMEVVKRPTPVTGATDHNVTKHYEIKEATATLYVNIYFPNNVDKSKADYANMELDVVGQLNQKNYKIPLGDYSDTANRVEGATVTYREKAPSSVINGIECSSYTVQIDGLPSNNHRYNVTLKGDGYRTANKVAIVDGTSEEINFWNNVMDESVKQDPNDSDDAKVTKNFLAGDIMMDNNIGLYDLNAVTSYYATTGNKDEDGSLADDGDSTKIQYDLNRDGKIDAQDIAYVLVSWGE